MNCKTQFQSIEELMEYVNREAERRAKEILKEHGINPDRDLNLKFGAAAGI